MHDGVIRTCLWCWLDAHRLLDIHSSVMMMSLATAAMCIPVQRKVGIVAVYVS